PPRPPPRPASTSRARRGSPFEPAPPAPGRPVPIPFPARHTRGPHRYGSGTSPHHPVDLHRGGGATGCSGGAGPLGQRPGEAVRTPRGAHHGADGAQPERTLRRTARDALAHRGSGDVAAPH